jgi:hypothetical protein
MSAIEDNATTDTGASREAVVCAGMLSRALAIRRLARVG